MRSSLRSRWKASFPSLNKERTLIEWSLLLLLPILQAGKIDLHLSSQSFTVQRSTLPLMALSGSLCQNGVLVGDGTLAGQLS